ncbi:uncharacterized protein [Coffea arabica]|uniref:CCHC-type domain-containing protein n=1 Tax=Coffea arabica TaxID=13443 RepID=A0ABM4WML9_COFAR
MAYFFPPEIRLQRMQQFENLRQTPGMSVVEYAHKFTTLGRFSPTILADESLKMLRYKNGLLSEIQAGMVNATTPTYSAMYEASLRAEAEIVRIKEVEKAKRPRPIDFVGNPNNPRQKGLFKLVKRVKVNTKDTSGSGKAVGKVARNNTPIAPECAYYHRRHPGECHWKTGACFNCGQVGHRAKDCSKPPRDVTKGPKSIDARPKANARIHAMTDMDIEGFDDVVTGVLSINSVPAYVLFDCGASHSFVSKRFVILLNMVSEWLDDPYRVSIPGNKILVSHIRYKGCQIDVGGKEFDADLVQIGVNDFDVILGMDCWSYEYEV